jgi:hypothetical protein
MTTITAAAEITTVVRIGKGLTLHAQMRGVEGPAAACGTVSRTFGAERHVTGAVSCRKCLDAIAAEEADAAEAAAEVEAFAAEVLEEVRRHNEEVVARYDAQVAADEAAEAPETVEEAPASAKTPAPAPEAAEAPAFVKGEVVLDKDGERFTVRRINANGSIRLVDALGNKVNRKASTLTKA